MSNPRAWIHSAAATLVGLLVAVVFDAAFGFVRLGASFGTAAWGCTLSAMIAAVAALSSPWAVGRRGGIAMLAATTAWGVWLAIFCVRSRWGFVSLVRVDGGYGPPAQLAIVLFSLTGLTASWLGRYLVRSASSRT
jgi:hypothetical protein